MVYEPKSPQFLTKDQLAFQEGARIRLRLTTQSLAANDVLVVGATREGKFSFRATLNSTGAEQNNTFSLPDIPIWVSVKDRTAAYTVGQCYVNLSLEMDNDPMWFLCAGYIYSNHSISWPTALYEHSVTHKGELKVVTGSNPAANAEISQTIPSSFVWRPKAIQFQLVTDANVATRQVHIEIQDNETSKLIDIPASGTQAAGLTRNYTFAQFPGTTPPNADNEIITALPQDLVLPTDWIIKTTTTNKQVGDNYGAPLFYVERQLIII